MQSGLAQRDQALLVALADDPDDHGLGVDVVDGQARGLADAQAARIHRGQASAHAAVAHAGE
jgi:hypothetical protein